MLTRLPALARRSTISPSRTPPGKAWSLADLKDKKAVVVVFLGTECPINNAYMPRLAELHKEYAAKGVQFVARQRQPPGHRRRASPPTRKKHDLPFPVLKDAGQRRRRPASGARRTPEAFVLDADAQGPSTSGRIDDQFGIGFSRPQPTRRDLAEPSTRCWPARRSACRPRRSPGCLIGRAVKPKRKATITYAKHVVPHLAEALPGVPPARPDRPDAAADLRRRRRLVGDDPRGGRARSDAALARRPEARQVQQRPQPVEGGARHAAGLDRQGCPKGDAKDLPPAKKFADGWSIGKPDVVFDDAEGVHGARRSAEGRHAVPVLHRADELRGGRWVQAAEAQAGQPGGGASHHRLRPRPPGRRGRASRRRRHRQRLAGRLRPRRPAARSYAAGTAKKIPKGASLVFQMHYTPNGIGAERPLVGRPDLRQGAAEDRGAQTQASPSNSS